MAARGNAALLSIHNRRIGFRDMILPAARHHLVNGVRDAVNGHGPDDLIHLRNLLLDLLPVALREAACSDEYLNLPFLFQLRHLQEGVHALLLGISDETAGIDHHGFRLCLIVRKAVSPLCQHAEHHFRIHQIFVTAKRNKQYFHRSD